MTARPLKKQRLAAMDGKFYDKPIDRFKPWKDTPEGKQEMARWDMIQAVEDREREG